MTGTSPPADARRVLDPVQPFDFEQSMAFLEGFTPCAGDHGCSAGRLTTGGYTAERPFLARVAPEADALAMDVDWLEEPGDLDAVGAWLSGFLSINDDLAPLYDVARDDPPFRQVV